MKTLVLACALVSTGLAATAQDWAGLYIGGGLNTDKFRAWDQSHGGDPFDAPGEGLTGFSGYNMQSGHWVFGPELQLGWGAAAGDDGEHQEPLDLGFRGELRGRVGYETGKFLPYLAIGYVSQAVKSTHQNFGPNDGDSDIARSNASGLGIALGVDWRIASRDFLRFEYQHIAFSDFQQPYASGSTSDMTLKGDRVLVGFGLSF